MDNLDYNLNYAMGVTIALPTLVYITHIRYTA